MYPKLFQIGPLTIYSYGVLLVVALLVSISLAARLAESDGIDRKRAWDLGFVIVLSGIVGAKLLLVLANLDEFVQQPSRLWSIEFLQSGGVYYGGLLGAVLGAVIFAMKNPDLKFWRLADAAAPAIALGQSIGRLGCFAAGCDYGKPADVPWAVTFTDSFAHEFVGVPIHTPLHPSQLYESAAALILFAFLYWAYRNRQFVGQTFCLYLICYGVTRFFLEFYRGDASRGFVFDGLLSTSQFISLLIVPFAVIAYFWLRPKSLRTRSA